jgi:valyl-tRNA synthetase
MADADHPPVAHPVEIESRRFWEARRLPPASGLFGPPDGPITRQFEGTWTAGDPPTQVVHRAVVADADARFLSISGRRSTGTLRRDPAPGELTDSPLPGLLARLGVWTGGTEGRTWDDSDQTAGVQAIVGRLARMGLLVARDAPMRVCLYCSAPRSPERIVYQQEVGDTLLVRFPLVGAEPVVNALVWVDAPWRLLGTSALLVNPDLTYVTVEYRRKEATAVLLTSRSSLDRLRAWLPEIELTVRSQTPGRELVGRAYSYPLRHEFPIGGTLSPPAGTIQAVADVGDSGTGIVPLVPGHGGTDAQIAERLGVTGWPLLTLSGSLDLTLMHKYSGLDLETANEFVERDLVEGGSVFARLRVMRGVPCCAICGHRMVWVPGRAWCLEPGHLPKEQADRYARLLPRDRPISQIEVAPWAVSEMTTAKGDDAVTLLECARCARLEAPDGPAKCPCGGRRHPVSRRLLPSTGGAFAAWAGRPGTSPTDSVRLYLDERRRSPALVHQLVAMTGLDRPAADVSLTLVPTVGVSGLDELIDRFGADAVRAAYVRSLGNEGGSASFEERCRQESARLDRIDGIAREVVERCDTATLQACAQPIGTALRELELEDRAILARCVHAHAKVVAEYDRSNPGAAHRELSQFVDRDLREYQELVRGRLALPGTPPSKRTALRTLAHLLRSLAVDLGPIVPFTAEAVRRRFVSDARSLFEGVDLSIDRALSDAALVADWARWRAVVRAVDQFRRELKLPPSALLPSVAIVLASEEVAGRLRAEHSTLERLARVERFEVGSPQTPWARRTRRLVPVEKEIQRAYPSMAAQIVHILQRMPPRRAGESAGKELSIVVHGVPRAITPAMVTAVDTLPDRVVPTPFALGEMYVELPAGGPAGAAAPPPLSPDAFWLVRRLRQRLRQAPAPAGGTGRVAIACALDPLGAELKEKATSLAQYLGLSELRVVEKADESTPWDRISGRTRTGSPWWVHLPGVVAEPRAPKTRASHPARRRVPVPEPGQRAAVDEVDYGAEAVVAEAQAIRDLGEELDALLAAPLLGPAKVSIAWEAGYRSVSKFGEDPFERLAALPGYGAPVASALWRKLGRTPPKIARPPRTRPPRSAPASILATAPPELAEPLTPPADAAASRPRERVLTRAVPGPPRPGPAARPTVRPLPPEPSPLSPAILPAPPAPATTEESTAPTESPEAAGPSSLEIAPEPTSTPAPDSAGGPAPGAVESTEAPLPTSRSEAPEPATAESAASSMDTEVGPTPEVTAGADLPSIEPAPGAPESTVRATEGAATIEPVSFPAAPAPAPPPDEPSPEVPASEAPHPESAPVEIPAVVEHEASVVGDSGAVPPGLAPPSPPEEPPDALPALETPAADAAAVDTPVSPGQEIQNPDEPALVPEDRAPPPVIEEPPAILPTPEMSVASDDVAEAPATPATEPLVPEVQGSSTESFPPPPEAPPATPVDVEVSAPDVAPAGAEPGSETEPETSVEPPDAVAAPPLPDRSTSGGLDAPTAPETPAPNVEVGLPPDVPSTPASEPADSAPLQRSQEPEPVGDLREPVERSAPEAEADAEMAPNPPAPTEVARAAEEVESSIARVPDRTDLAVAATTTVLAETPAVTEEAVEVSELPTPPAPPIAMPGETPAPPEAESPPVEPPLVEPIPAPPTGLEVDTSDSLFQALLPFLDATAAGHKGVAIVRELPERIRTHVGPRPVEVYWLSNLGRKQTIRPSDLAGISEFVRRALLERGVTAFFVEGAEYLILMHGIDKVVELLHGLDAEVIAGHARLWLHLTPALLPSSDLERIVAEFAPGRSDEADARRNR